LQNILRINPKVHAKKTIEATAKVFLVGLRQVAAQVFTALCEETRQVQQAAGMGLIGRGQVKTDCASRAKVFIAHAFEKKGERAKVKRTIRRRNLYPFPNI
jgi:23S rRNA A2030 N6-methylase RlmJ